MAQQTPRAARRAIADAVIFNDGIALDVPCNACRCRCWQHWMPGCRGVTPKGL